MSKPQDEIIPGGDHRIFIDAGNSYMKAAAWDGFSWSRPFRAPSGNIAALAEWADALPGPVSGAIAISVVDTVGKQLVASLGPERCRLLTVKDIPADLLDYETPGTLGLDRFFGCYGAMVHTRKAAVVIDAGTAWTIDFMSADGLYRGGAILPGIGLVEAALKSGIPALPKPPRTLPDAWPGKSSVGSVQWGTSGMFAAALEAMLGRFREMGEPFELFVTGGDAKTVVKLLETPGKIRPNLVLEGMRNFLRDFL